MARVHGECIALVLQQQIVLIVRAGPDADGVEVIQVCLPGHGVEELVFDRLVIPFSHGLHLRFGAEMTACDERERVRMASQNVGRPANQMRARQTRAIDADHQPITGRVITDSRIDAACGRRRRIVRRYLNESNRIGGP